jgi:tetratricopeptide (TPR) repeat protein
MATAVRPAPASLARRREILDWHCGLRGKGAAQVLGVPADADAAAVKAAFTALMKRFHPDVLGEADADLRAEIHAIFIRINEAYREMQTRPASPPRRDGARAPRPPAPREPAAPKVPGPVPRPAPALDPEARHARVTDALAAAKAFLADTDPTAAVGALHEVVGLADDAERERIRRLLARAYVSEPKWRRYGVSLLAEILRESPGDAEVLATLGALYLREGLLARAESTLRRALDADPRNGEARAHLRAATAALADRRARENGRPPERPGLVARLLSFAR